MTQDQRTNKNVGITLPPWAVDKLARLAIQRKLTKSGLIQALLAEAQETQPRKRKVA